MGGAANLRRAGQPNACSGAWPWRRIEDNLPAVERDQTAHDGKAEPWLFLMAPEEWRMLRQPRKVLMRDAPPMISDGEHADVSLDPTMDGDL